MYCDYFNSCGSCTLHSISYEEQLLRKLSALKELFGSLYVDDLDIFRSPPIHYRNRAEFRIWHEGDKISFAMYGFDKRPVLIDACPKTDVAISKLMPNLLQNIEKKSVLKERLFSIEFLSATEGILVTLVYHKSLNQEWEDEAKLLERDFGIHIIGRSRGVKKVLSSNAVWDCLHVKGKNYRYYLEESAFSQPNRSVNSQMISWVMNRVENAPRKDLLELYCGHGNFTLPLSNYFEKVLATEISKASIASALKNCQANERENITFIRLSAQELTQALEKERDFKRLKDIDLDSFSFSHLLVDPPRAGLDEKSCAFASRFETIIYISCNPQTLLRDIKTLSATHKIKAMAAFDQFPYTHHLECGVILTSA